MQITKLRVFTLRVHFIADITVPMITQYKAQILKTQYLALLSELPNILTQMNGVGYHIITLKHHSHLYMHERMNVFVYVSLYLYFSEHVYSI